MNAKRITYNALLLAVAMALTVLEHSLPPLFAFAPGAKLGLSNAVCLFAVLFLGIPDATVILIGKCLFGALFAGNVGALLYSLPAGTASLLIEIVMLKTVFPLFSITGISVTGAVVFNAVQLIVASLITGTALYAALPVFLLASVTAGMFTGLAVYYLFKSLPKSVYLTKNRGRTT